MRYNTKIEIDLEPVGSPTVLIAVGEFTEQTIIDTAITKTFDVRQLPGAIKIAVELLGKSDTDPDTAVIIKAIRFNGIASPKFAWAGVYYPSYPKAWSTEQHDLKPVLPGQTYLGWNGAYELEVTVPIFTWMHQTLGLGWVFE